MEPPVVTGGSYQSEPSAPKTFPRLVGAAWAGAQPEIAVDERGQASALCRVTNGLRREWILFPPYSPVHRFDPLAERRRTKVLGQFSKPDGAWEFQVAPGVLGNGQPDATLRNRGDVIETEGHEWVLDEGEPPELNLGPLWNEFRRGALRLDAGPRPYRATLQVTQFGKLDSLEGLRRIIDSDFATQLASLELHIGTARHDVDWPAFVAQHRHLASRAPFRVTLVEAPRPHGVELSHDVVPWVLMASALRQQPLVRDGGDWVLRFDGGCLRWHSSEAGVRQRLVDGTLDALVPWFHPTFAHGHEGMLFMPGRSDFLAGQHPFQGPALDEASVRVFVDDLLARGDLAGELLARVAAGDEARLHDALAPWSSRSFDGERGISIPRSAHVHGFFRRVSCEVWPDFERDLALLLSHPLLARLENLELDVNVGGMTASIVSARGIRLSFPGR
jgi:hypothetical protein